MSAGLQLYSLYLLLLVIDFPDQYNTIHCKLANENSVCDKLYHTSHNSLENLSQFTNEFINCILMCLLDDLQKLRLKLFASNTNDFENVSLMFVMNLRSNYAVKKS